MRSLVVLRIVFHSIRRSCLDINHVFIVTMTIFQLWRSPRMMSIATAESDSISTLFHLFSVASRVPSCIVSASSDSISSPHILRLRPLSIVPLGRELEHISPLFWRGTLGDVTVNSHCSHWRPRPPFRNNLPCINRCLTWSTSVLQVHRSDYSSGHFRIR